MKTTPLLFTTILFWITTSLAQAQTAQPGSTTATNSDVTLVTGFLDDLSKGQFESAHKRLAVGFEAYGPGYNDKLGTDNLLEQWNRNGQRFANQQLTIETTSTTLVPTGNNQGQWVYVKGIWSAVDGRGQGHPIRIPFHQVARVNNGKIERTYTSYGVDQIFYDLGFSLYAGPSGASLRR